jgi:hypothetical protein
MRAIVKEWKRDINSEKIDGEYLVKLEESEVEILTFVSKIGCMMPNGKDFSSEIVAIVNQGGQIREYSTHLIELL